MTRIRLDYVHEFRDRHGKVRRYFRRPGFKQTPLPGLPGSDEFMEVYRAALAGDMAPRLEIGASRTKPGTVNAAIVAYYASAEFKVLAPTSQSTVRGRLERCRADHGDKRIALLQREHIDRMVSALADRPVVANNLLKTIRLLIRFAVERRWRTDDPTVGIKRAKVRSSGIHSWIEDEIVAFAAKHPVGSRARLAFALLLYSGQRRSDVIRIGRQHIRDGALHLTQQKTGATLAVPIHSELASIIEATPSDHLTFLTTRDGSPFTAAGFGGWFAQVCREAGLKECSAHGLRKAACRRLAEAGCSAHEIMAISGHASLREVQRYCDAADQARRARTAMATVAEAFPANGRRTTSGKPQ